MGSGLADSQRSALKVLVSPDGVTSASGIGGRYICRCTGRLGRRKSYHSCRCIQDLETKRVSQLIRSGEVVRMGSGGHTHFCSWWMMVWTVEG